MATPQTGRYCAVTLTSAAVVINNLGHWEINFAGDELDASAFGTVWKRNMAGMMGWTATVEGFFDPSTGTNTQMTALMDAALDGTKIQDIRFKHTSTGLFWMPNFTSYGGGYVANLTTENGAFISNVRVTADKNALISASFNVVGYGDIALFNGGSSFIVVEGT